MRGVEHGAHRLLPVVIEDQPSEGAGTPLSGTFEGDDVEAARRESFPDCVEFLDQGIEAAVQQYRAARRGLGGAKSIDRKRRAGVRNVVAGSLAKRLGLKEGDAIEPAIVEFYYKNDALGDPLVNDDHLRLLRVATPAVLRELRELAHSINAVLKPFFAERQMKLVDFKLEFGVYHNKLILADEISPDTCRLWDLSTGESMDKDRFRKDMGKIEEAYQEVLRRVCG